MRHEEGTVVGAPSEKAPTEPGRYDRARVARLQPIKDAVDQLRLPPLRLRKLLGILNAVEMQIEDGGDHPHANDLLLDALRAALRHQVSEPQAQVALRAIDAFAQAESERWAQIRAGTAPALELTPDEQLDDLIQQGYELLRAGRAAAACDVWLAAWEKVKQLVRPGMNTIEALEHAYPELAPVIFNWRSDLELALGNAGLDDARYLEHRLRFAREYLALFPDEGADSQVFFRRAEGEALWGLGRRAEAEAFYATLVARCPDEGWAYIGWSDNSWLDRRSNKDYGKAESILQRALARTGVSDRGDILERLRDLYAEWGKPEQAAAVALQVKQLHEPAASASRTALAPSAGMAPRIPLPRKIGHNAPCWCGSGKKYKHCHLRQDRQ